MITLSELEQYLSKAAWILKGPVDASDYKVYIFPLLFFKRISDTYKEEYQSLLEESNDKEYARLPEFHKFNIPVGCLWDDVREKTTNVGQELLTAFRSIESSNKKKLSGIFGDASWSNKEKLSDQLLIDLIEHFSKYNLSNSNVDPDMLGQAYEYLIKHFADLTNKKAGEFYTPRSVIHLMSKIIDPKPGESIYDPACGTGGMLLQCINQVKESGKDYRTVSLFGQEKNLTSSSIARMNMFLHGYEDFNITRGDTLRNPAFLESDRLKQFDCVIANPPFSLKEWGADKWANDPYGRNVAGVPPKGNGDMAWIQHMLSSTNDNSGRMIIVMPHGVLFRKGAEGKIRKKLIEMDIIDTIIGLGPNLFYGTPLATSIIIFDKNKPSFKKNKIQFIDAAEEIRVGRAQNYFEKEHMDKVFSWYKSYEDVENYVKISSLSEIEENEFNMNIPLHVEKLIEDNLPSVEEAKNDLKKSWDSLLESEERFNEQLKRFIQ